jgi:hypothetical protein
LAQEVDGALHIDALTELLGESQGRFESDVVETMQLVDRHRLQDLIDGGRWGHSTVIQAVVALRR